MPHSSEIHAYVWIKERLEELDWNVSNPERNPNGEVYTQHECLQNDLIKSCLRKDIPENVVIVRSKKFLVIEAKRSRGDMKLAEKEAKEYADKLNTVEILCPIAVAVAGNPEDSFETRTFYFTHGAWKEVLVNGRLIGGLPSKDIARRLVDKDTNIIEDLQISDKILYKKATKINEILHKGSINKNYRARVMSALLLAMAEDTPINVNNETPVLIDEINSRVRHVLDNHGRKNFASRIEIQEPTSKDNHVKVKRALVDTIQELEDLNIRSAMNSGTDVLGRFYEIFLKYGNGAKEIGIVLTPRHITRFAAQALRVSKNDKVFDPACGTGGFLVAAFDLVRKSCNERELDNFKVSGIYGIEQESEVMALALVNMIFRGDGKNNIEEGDCFSDKYFVGQAMTKFLMNPPFALKKEDEKEYKFIDYALRKLETGGLLFAVVPSPVMFREKGFKDWRESVLRHHTLKAVIKFPKDLFYPVGVHTSAVIIEAHVPHPEGARVLWASLEDGFAKRKGVRKQVDETNDGNTSEVLRRIHAQLDGHDCESQPREWIQAGIEMDKHLECAPEQYLEDTPPPRSEVVAGMKSALLNVVSGKMSKDVA